MGTASTPGPEARGSTERMFSGPNLSGLSARELTYGPDEPELLAVEEVRMVEEEMNPYVIT
jgi:hypothetical protein